MATALPVAVLGGVSPAVAKDPGWLGQASTIPFAAAATMARSRAAFSAARASIISPGGVRSMAADNCSCQPWSLPPGDWWLFCGEGRWLSKAGGPTAGEVAGPEAAPHAGPLCSGPPSVMGISNRRSATIIIFTCFLDSLNDPSYDPAA